MTDKDLSQPTADDRTTSTTKSTTKSETDTDGAGTRTRTRTRTRATPATTTGRSASEEGEAKAPAARKRASAKRDDDDGDAKGSERSERTASSGSDDDADGDDASRRRRRGSRGRGGRGRGRGGSSGESSGGRAKASTDGEDDGDTPAAKRGGSGRSGSGRDSSDRDDSDRDGSGKDDSVKESIARSGTRVAAQSSRRGGGSSSSSRSRSGGGGGGSRGRTGGVSEEVRRAVLEGPPRTMLVSSRGGRNQLAVLEDRTLVEHYVTRNDNVSYVGNIYMARVQNVLPGMEAAFLDIGKGRNGVLYAGEVLYDELDLEGEEARIENALKPGQKVLVQVTKDPMGHKGARLTQHLSLAGRYMVLAPNSDVFGISRKLTDDERDRLRKILKRVKPSEHGVIVRTAAEGATEEQIEADIARLLAKWDKVTAKAEEAKALTTVYEEPRLVVRVIRDNFGPEYVTAVFDDAELHDAVKDYLEDVAPELVDKLSMHNPPEPGKDEEPLSLFAAYHVAEQLRKAMDKKVWLPSGGYLIIEKTEAMTVIDVNTGKFTGKSNSNLEETVLKNNLEAADEIVRQLRLRDIGGIIVIDFIDMLLKTNQDAMVRRLKRELLRDRTKTRVSEVSRLGLVQMTRKNVSQGLIEAFSEKCDKCGGQGIVTHLDH